ncbi:phosphoribosylglycinamide formyltransferase [Geomonas sp. Red69]|uniref:Phosphoribosylglycinamide formyltransferase n=1 Tax=Geomonas diazotrophica TaxID=2843197 RepID=A0ABX8JPI8_9BACT|nr:MULTISPECIES: phosphoribosylglycinamide formyltransferase [Geomonas]MBU5637312.1 phosphoribosylglycinamide formyltransferase [Geomonas diazotrophica]QWV99599.1 phosphoribosylglycinamide formyltransferase [Geomonas nitrogeniifigens]QXE88772.1 phosphoribosylglycinamide formyltransferase [Geomonas nitrogeniifigens]
MGNELKIGVLISGSGSNLQSIMDACAKGTINGRVVCVISNKADAFGLERARKAGIPALHLDHRAYTGREAYDEALVATLREFDVDLVVLAGFMRIITSVLLDAFPMRVMNIHPALLPAFPGLHAQRQALEYGAKVAGCTVHFVDCGTDTGPIIIQAAVPILAGDTEESLCARIQKEEHRIYPEAVRLFSEGLLQVDGRVVTVSA